MQNIQQMISKLDVMVFTPSLPNSVKSKHNIVELQNYALELMKKKFVVNYLTMAVMNKVINQREANTLVEKASTNSGLNDLYIHLLSKISEISVNPKEISETNIIFSSNH